MNYLLIGNEYYNLRKRKAELLKNINNKDLNVSVYNDCVADDIDEIVSDCQTVPFFDDKKVVICVNPSFFLENKSIDKNCLKKLTDYLKNPQESTDLIFYIEKNGKINQNVFKQLTKYFKIEKYDILNEQEFIDVIKKDLRENNIIIDNAGLNLLIKRLPIDLENWKNELEKLCLYNAPLNKEAIDNLICRQLEKDAFALTNAINKNDLVSALSIYHDLLTLNKNDLLGLLALIATQYRTMSQYKILREMGNTNNDIAQKMNVSAGSVYYKLKECDNRSGDELLKILDSLATLDQNIKSGKIEPILGLEIFIVKTIRS